MGVLRATSRRAEDRWLHSGVRQTGAGDRSGPHRCPCLRRHHPPLTRQWVTGRCHSAYHQLVDYVAAQPLLHRDHQGHEAGRPRRVSAGAGRSCAHPGRGPSPHRAHPPAAPHGAGCSKPYRPSWIKLARLRTRMRCELAAWHAAPPIAGTTPTRAAPDDDHAG